MEPESRPLVLTATPETDQIPEPATATPVIIVNTFPIREVTRAAFALLCVLLGFYVVYKIQEVILLLMTAVLLATAIEPLVNRLRRGPFNRGTGILTVYAIMMAIIGFSLFLIVPQVLQQAATISETLPRNITALRGTVSEIQLAFVRDPLLRAIDSFPLTASIDVPSETVMTVGMSLAHAVISFMTVFVLAFYWLTERNRIKRLALKVAGPANARNVNTMWLEVEEKLGFWVRGQFVLMAAMGITTAIGYTVLGLPNVALLAFIAAIGEGIPLIGTVIGFAPAILIALTIDPSKAVQVLIFCLVAQQIESNVLVPRVMAHSVGISPLTVLLGILIGGTLYGLPGAFFAVPIAGAIQVIAAHMLGAEDPEQKSVHGNNEAPDPADDESATKAVSIATPG